MVNYILTFFLLALSTVFVNLRWTLKYDGRRKQEVSMKNDLLLSL